MYINLKVTSLFLMLVNLFYCQNGSAQRDTSINEALVFHPFHLINNGIRIDYDRKINKNHWIQIGPQFYAAERGSDNIYRDFKELIGVGISAYHRIYLSKKNPPFGAYFSYGLTYNYFNLKYDDDNTSSTFKKAETKINKIGGDIVVGYQTLAFDKLIVDLYAGLGGRYSDKKYTGTRHEPFNDFMYNYGFTGNVIILGLRLGFGF